MRGGWSSPTPYTPIDGENKAITTKKKAYMFVQALKSLLTVANKDVIKAIAVATSCWDVLGLDR